MIRDEYTENEINRESMKKAMRGVEPPARNYGIRRDIKLRKQKYRDANWME